MDNELILIISDAPEDVVLMRRAFAGAGLTNRLWSVESAEEAASYLGGQGKYADRVEHPLPGVVLLDVKIGLGVLKWMRRREELQHLAVAVLTSTRDLRKLNQVYQLGASSLLVKPLDERTTGALVKVVKELLRR